MFPIIGSSDSTKYVTPLQHSISVRQLASEMALGNDVHEISKPGKDPKLVENLQPISLLSTMTKVSLRLGTALCIQALVRRSGLRLCCHFC